MKKILIIIMCALLLTGCKGNKDSEKTDTVTTTTSDIISLTDSITQTITQDVEVTTTTTVEPKPEFPYYMIEPNETGSIMVVMYHGILDNPPYHRTAEDFRKDLQYMYDNGYRLITMADYLSGNIEVEAGYTPIVLTFDDGLKTTFALEEKDGEFVPVKDTAVYILEEMYAKYPDFGRAAVFYLNTSNGFFLGAGTEKERLEWLTSRGYEVSTHTATHINMSDKTNNELLKEIGGSIQYIRDILGEDYRMESFAYPFGSTPKDKEQRKYLLDGTYGDTTYSMKIGLAVGVSGPFVMSYDTRFNKYKAPRVRASDTEEASELWDYFVTYEKNPKARYISDGIANVITIKKDAYKNINLDAIQSGMTLRVTLSQQIEDFDKDGIDDFAGVYWEEDKVYFQFNGTKTELECETDISKLIEGKVNIDSTVNAFNVKVLNDECEINMK